jgi:hypothetical protein
VIASSGVEHVDAARHAGIERVNRAQDLERLFGIRERMMVHQRRLIRPRLPLAIARRAVPGARDHALIARDLAVFDLNPVAQRAARRVEKSVALRFRRPCLGLPLLAVVGAHVAALDTSHQGVVPMRQAP